MATYEDIESLHRKVHEASGKLFSAECALAEEAISSSFGSYAAIAKGGKLGAKSQHLLALFYRNCVYLSAAYELMRRGMLDPAGNNLRTVFETIVWQYAILCDGEVYANIEDIDALEGQKLALVRSKKWSNTKERELENLRRKHNFQKVMKKLYSKEVFERFFFNQYWALCQKSHASVFGANNNTPNMEGGTTIEKRPEELKGNLFALLYLCAENLTCFLNCFSTECGHERTAALLALANRINKSVPPALGLAPDTKALEFIVRFREV